MSASRTDADLLLDGVTKKPHSRPEIAVLIVAAVYGAIQFLVLDLSVFLGWDEAVYLSEVSRFAEAVGMAAHRSRGITLVVAPIALVTDSIVALRAYLIVVSSVALFGAFHVWTKSIGWGAPVAAGIFASSWMTLFFGGQISPNLYSALLCVAAIGMALRYMADGLRSHWWVLTALVGAAVIFRPLDGVMLGAAVVLVGSMTRTRRLMLQSMAAAGLGVVVGMIPWVVEAALRFGGPLERLERAGELVGGGLTNNLTEYLNLLDGPLVWTGVPDGVTPWAIAWIVLLLGLAGYAIVVASDHRQAARSAVASAALVALPYGVWSDVAAPRFMMPALGLLCVGAGVGIIGLFQSHRSRLVPGALAVLLLALSLGWNMPVYSAFVESHLRAGERVVTLGAALQDRADGEECFVLTPHGHPQIAVASGCRSARLAGDGTDQRRIDQALRREERVFALVPEDEITSVANSDWNCTPVEGLPVSDWQLCVYSELAGSM